jgi:hypothetical protein
MLWVSLAVHDNSIRDKCVLIYWNELYGDGGDENWGRSLIVGHEESGCIW